jgi:hypothetical protein
MRIEDDPCIPVVSCPVCQAAKTVPCSPPNYGRDTVLHDRKYILSHMGRIKAYINLMAQGEHSRDAVTVADFYLLFSDGRGAQAEEMGLRRLMKKIAKRLKPLPLKLVLKGHS